MPTTKTLGEKIERLCARCDLLHRENKLLKKENLQLRTRNQKAKAQLQHLLTQLPKDSDQ